MGEIIATCGHRIEADEVKGVWWLDTEIDWVIGKVEPAWNYGVLCPACLGERTDWHEKPPWEAAK